MSRQSAWMNIPVVFGHNVIGATNGSCGDYPLPGRGDQFGRCARRSNRASADDRSSASGSSPLGS